MRLVASQMQLEGDQKLKDPGDGSGTSGEEGRFDREQVKGLYHHYQAL